MGLVSRYTNDVFISYSHIDNEPFGDPRGGWVDIFHEQLQNFVNVHLGRRTQVWRDRRLSGAEVFPDEIDQHLRSSAVLTAAVQQRTDAPRRDLGSIRVSLSPAGQPVLRQTKTIRIGG